MLMQVIYKVLYMQNGIKSPVKNYNYRFCSVLCFKSCVESLLIGPLMSCIAMHT